MFLWLTSPTPSENGRGSYVLNSPIFYNAWSTGASSHSLAAGASPRSLVAIGGDKISRREISLDVKIDNIEPGQADRDATVLMTRDRRLVYYLVEVNDVYAYFLTKQSTDIIKATHFPASKSDLDDIEKFGRDHKKEFTDANTLVVELKSAWIEADRFKPSELKRYVTIDATIPVYEPLPSSPATTLMRKDTKVKQLALIGMHVVFSVKGHPEMLWATFEHVNNTPNPMYKYFAKHTGLKFQHADPPGKWVLPANSAVCPVTFNEPRMHFDSGTRNIEAHPGKTIGPSDICRESPWGSDPLRGTQENSQIISVNKQVRHLLARGDVRRNYIMIGTTWATTQDNPPGRGNQTGSTKLVNTTMETFYNKGVSTCFECHTGNMLGDKDKKTGLSLYIRHSTATPLP